MIFILKKIIDILNKPINQKYFIHKNFWWLDFGQLLSIHRNNNFLEWVDDFDFCVIFENNNYDHILNQLKQHNFIIKHSIQNKFIQFSHYNINNKTKRIENLFFNIHKHKGYQMPLFHYNKLNIKEINGLLFNVPQKLDLYLNTRYGNDYMIPIKKDMSSVTDNINYINKQYFALVPGVFDYFHIGHRNLIDKALKLFDKVIIGVHNDKDINYKEKPHNNQDKRINDILKYYPNIQIIKNCPLKTDKFFLKRSKIDFVIFGYEDSHNLSYFYPNDEFNYILERTDGISSSKIRNENIF